MLRSVIDMNKMLLLQIQISGSLFFISPGSCSDYYFNEKKNNWSSKN